MSSPHRFRLGARAPVLLAVVLAGLMGCDDGGGGTSAADSAGASATSAGRLTDAYDEGPPVPGGA